MNKIIFTNERLFMAMVGPSGSGKTQLIFDMLRGDTFWPNIKKVYFFYQEYQPLYDTMQHDLPLDIQFVSVIDFDMIEQIENALLIFDDSCEDIYNEKRFLKLAVSGRHKKVGIIYVKHNLFHQSKQSKTIDLQNTHVILFKSPRDENQIAYLGKQLGTQNNFLLDCYKKATSVSYGHLLIDFDPKTSDCLRYCSNIVGPLPTIFFLPSSKAVISSITDERERAAYAKVFRVF